MNTSRRLVERLFEARLLAMELQEDLSELIHNREVELWIRRH